MRQRDDYTFQALWVFAGLAANTVEKSVAGDLSLCADSKPGTSRIEATS